MSDDADFIAALGRPFVAHRLRRLSELFVDGYAAWLPAFGVTAPARALSTLLLLDREGPLGVTEIAARLRLSHPLLIRMTGQLAGQGLIAFAADPKDARRRPATLTAKGRAEAERIRAAAAVLDRAYAELFAEIGADLVDLAGRVEAACLRDGFAARLERAAEQINQTKGRDMRITMTGAMLGACLTTAAFGQPTQAPQPRQPVAGQQPGPTMVRRMRGAPTPPPAFTGESARVPMSFDRAMPVVDVMVNGRGPYRFGIDTGAQGHGRVAPALAQELGLTVSGQSIAGDGSGRTQTRNRYRADRLGFGGLVFEAAELTELNDPRRAEAGIQGILGLDLFARHLLTLDYAGRTVTVAPGALPAGAIGYQGEGVIILQAAIGELALPVRLDTGNSVAPLLVPAALAERIPASGPARRVGQARTAISTIDMMEVPVSAPVRIGGTIIPVTAIGYPALGDIGNLGSRALATGSVSIDQANRRIAFRFGGGQ